MPDACLPSRSSGMRAGETWWSWRYLGAGVPVAYEVATRLGVPDVFIVRKLGLPGHEELAMELASEAAAREHVAREQGDAPSHAS